MPTATSLAPPSWFAADPASRIGEAVQLHLDADYGDTNSRRVTEEADWSSSSDRVATVSGGLLTGRSAGRGEVRASYAGHRVRLGFEVAPGFVESGLSLDLPPWFRHERELCPGQQAQLHLVAVSPDGTRRRVTDEAAWTVSNPRVATVVRGLLTGRREGYAELRASHGGDRVRLRFEVEERDDDDCGEEGLVESGLSLEFPPWFRHERELYHGQQVQLHLFAVSPDGTRRRVTDEATWTVSNPRVATVVRGLLTGRREGYAELRVSHAGRQLRLRFEVDD